MIKPSFEKKLQLLVARHQEIGELLSDPVIIHDQNRFRDLSKEYSHLEPIVNCFQRYQFAQESIQAAQIMLKDDDHTMREMAQAEIEDQQAHQVVLEQELQVLLLPQDPNDNCNVFLEIRGAAGGDESAIFAGDLFRMYSRFAENKGWQVEVIQQSTGEHGGYKLVVARIVGQGAYSQLKFESGAHRVQRVPDTEAQGRIHTSTCTVAILPEIEEVSEVDINPADLKIDTFRASGAGGQHVNKTDSAIRITHVPSGLVVECQEERSQHKNRAKALSLLKARLLDAELSKQRAEQAQTRRNLVGTGDRSERIRTYNFPQGRMTDHRINLTLYKLEDIMEGNITPIIEPLIREHQADLLASVGDN